MDHRVPNIGNGYCNNTAVLRTCRNGGTQNWLEEVDMMNIFYVTPRYNLAVVKLVVRSREWIKRYDCSYISQYCEFFRHACNLYIKKETYKPGGNATERMTTLFLFN